MRVWLLHVKNVLFKVLIFKTKLICSKYLRSKGVIQNFINITFHLSEAHAEQI